MTEGYEGKVDYIELVDNCLVGFESVVTSSRPLSIHSAKVLRPSVVERRDSR